MLKVQLIHERNMPEMVVKWSCYLFFIIGISFILGYIPGIVIPKELLDLEFKLMTFIFGYISGYASTTIPRIKL